MNKRETQNLENEVEIVRFEGGDIDGLRKSALILYTNDNRKVQFIVDKSVLSALGGMDDDNKTSLFNVTMAIISAMGARIEKAVIYSEGKDQPNRAKIHLRDTEGAERFVDTVPDYAVVLTFCMGGSLKVTESVLNEKAHSIFDERFRYLFTGKHSTMDILKNRSREELENDTVEDLNRFLKMAIENEEYQIAALLKQIIESKTTQS